MVTRIIEDSFMLVSTLELDEGLKHARKKDGVFLIRQRLRTIANNAGKNMHGEPGLTPRQATVRAMQAYHNEYLRVQFPQPYFDGYVHAVAKIMSNRSPAVMNKRACDRETSERNAASFGIDMTKNIDPVIQTEIMLMTDKVNRRHMADA